MTPEAGFRVYGYDPACDRWARAAHDVAVGMAADPRWRGPDNLRHGRTWFVGVDALPNDAQGAVAGVPLAGPWQADVPALPLHRAQISIVYPGYPRRDEFETEAAHRFRRDRAAAHVDGLLPVGPEKRRFALEYHAYILALPLTQVAAAPTVVWPGSHRIMQDALRQRIGQGPVASCDLTEAYQAARRTVLAAADPVPLKLERGQSALLHPFLLHGTAPWDPSCADPAGHGRITAFFRPECAGGADAWLALP